MPNVTRARTSSPAAPRTTDLLKVKVQENDPTLKATATAFGFKVTGAASNNGVVASFLQLSVDGKKVDLQLSRGDTGVQVFKKLQKALPEGYEGRVLENLKSMPPQMTIGISKKAQAPQKFPGTVKDAGWSPRSGMATPGGGGARMGLFVNVQINPLTTLSSKVKVDAASKTITVTVSGKTGRPNQMADTQKKLDLGVPSGMQMGTRYKLVVQDAAGHKLFGTMVSPFPAA